MASPLRLPAGLITLLAGPLHPTTSATVMPNLWPLCGSYSRLGYSGRCQAPGWSMHLQETYTAWWMASSDEIGQGDTQERARRSQLLCCTSMAAVLAGFPRGYLQQDIGMA